MIRRRMQVNSRVFPFVTVDVMQQQSTQRVRIAHNRTTYGPNAALLANP
ncbi:hypothetical protein [Methanomethylovorans hollandica]|nr:hypothetical protein [Methanomethylovorans hollandica]